MLVIQLLAGAWRGGLARGRGRGYVVGCMAKWAPRLIGAGCGVQDFALDSMENLLFSIARFKE